MQVSLVIKSFKIVLLISILIQYSESKDQYVEPLNMGMKCSVPYDIANIFNRANPIHGTVAVVLSMVLLGIIFFGIITAPFGYFYGIPSQKYVLGDLKTVYQEEEEQEAAGPTTASSRISNILNQIETFDMSLIDSQDNEFPRSLKEGLKEGIEEEEVEKKSIFTKSFWETLLKKVSPWIDSSEFSWSGSPRARESLTDMIWEIYIKLTKQKYSPDFLQSMFYLMPTSDSELMSEGCQLLTLCYAHGAMKDMPLGMFKVYSVFSQKMRNIPNAFKEAMLLGLGEDSINQCPKMYSKMCSENAFTIVVKSFINSMPKEATSSTVHKRKQEMYM